MTPSRWLGSSSIAQRKGRSGGGLPRAERMHGGPGTAGTRSAWPAAVALVLGLAGCSSTATEADRAAPTAAAPAAAAPAAAAPVTSTPPGPSSPVAPGAPTAAEPAAPPTSSPTALPAGARAGKPTPRGQLHRHLLDFDTGSQPKQVIFHPGGREIWVTPLADSRGVEVYDAGTGRRTARIKLGGGGAVEVIFSRDGSTAYVSQMETGSVFAIDTQAKQVRRRYATRGVWTKVLALSPDERTIYAANWSSNDVSAIDLASGDVRRYPTVTTPRGLFVTPDGKRLYVAGYENGEIQRVDLDSGKGQVLLRTGGAMRHLVGDPRTGLVYADDMAQETVHVLDPRTDKVRLLARTDENPNTIDLSPDGTALYVSNRGRNGASYLRPGPEWGSVVVLDTATGKPLDAIVGGNQTTGLDVSPDGTRLAFSDFLDNRVNVYEIPAREVLAAGGGGRYDAHRADLRK